MMFILTIMSTCGVFEIVYGKLVKNCYGLSEVFSCILRSLPASAALHPVSQGKLWL